MRCLFIVSAVSLAALTMATLIPDQGLAQQLPTPPHGLQPPPPPPVKPYKPVAVAPPGAYNDPSFEAFHKSLAAIAQRKDRAALAKLVVAQGFFWIQDKDIADHGKPGIDNLARAIDLDDQNGGGWDIIANYAADGTAAAVPQRKDLVCAPAPPAFDSQAMEALLQQTQTDPTEWAYAPDAGTEVRAAGQPNAQVVDKLGLYLVRVLPDSPAGEDGNAPAFLHVALPSGTTGFVAFDALAPLATDQICYVKDASGWKIAGYVGGVQP
jgi:hypothetical protein